MGVDELWQGNAGGDILVFLPGEREIREAADHLRKHLSHQPGDAQRRGAAAVRAPVAGRAGPHF
jgi:HrpA-like RNA helicase